MRYSHNEQSMDLLKGHRQISGTRVSTYILSMYIQHVHTEAGATYSI